MAADPDFSAAAPGHHTGHWRHCVVDGCCSESSGPSLFGTRVALCDAHIGGDNVVRCQLMRACHKCTALHPLTAFDGERRCCRRSLQKLAKRRQQGRQEAAEAAAAAATDGHRERADASSDVAATARGAGSGRSAAAKRNPKAAGGSVPAAAAAAALTKAAKAAARRITVQMQISCNDSSAATTESAPPRKQPRRGARRDAGELASGSGSGSGSMDDGGRAAAPRPRLAAGAAVAGDAGLLRADRDGRLQVTSASGGAAGAEDVITAATAGAAAGGAVAAIAAGRSLDGAGDGGVNSGLQPLSGRHRPWSAAAVQESQRLLHEWSHHHGSSHNGGGNTVAGATSALAAAFAKPATDDICDDPNGCAAAVAPAVCGRRKRPLGDVVADAGAGAHVDWPQRAAGEGGSSGCSDAGGQARRPPLSPPQQQRRTTPASPLRASGLLAANALQLPAEPLAQQPTQQLQLPQHGTMSGGCPPEPLAPAAQLHRSASGGSSTNSFGTASYGAAAQAPPQQQQQVPWGEGLLLAPSDPTLAGYAVQTSPPAACVQQLQLELQPRAVVTTAVQIVQSLRFDAPVPPVYSACTNQRAPLDTHPIMGPPAAAAGPLAWATCPEQEVAHGSYLQQQQLAPAALELLPAGASCQQLPRLCEFEVMLFSKPSTITPVSGPEEQVRLEQSPLLVVPPPPATAATAATGGVYRSSATTSGSAGVFGCGRWAAADSSCSDGEASGSGSGDSAAAEARRAARRQLHSSAHAGELLRAAELLGAPEILDSLGSLMDNGDLQVPPLPLPLPLPHQQHPAILPQLQASALLDGGSAAARLWGLHAGGEACVESSALHLGCVQASCTTEAAAAAAVPTATAAGCYSDGLSALGFSTSSAAQPVLGFTDFGACPPGNWVAEPAMAAPATQQLQQLAAWGPDNVARGSSWPDSLTPQLQPPRGVEMWASGPLGERAGSNSGNCADRPCARSQQWQQQLQLYQQDLPMRPPTTLMVNNNTAPESYWCEHAQVQPQVQLQLHQYGSSAGRQPAVPSPPPYQLQHTSLRQSTPPPAQLRQQEQQRGIAVSEGRCQLAPGFKQAPPACAWEWPQEEVRGSTSGTGALGRQQVPVPWGKAPVDTSYVNVMKGYHVTKYRA